MSSEFPIELREWFERGAYREVGGREIFCLDTGPSDSREVVVVLHGFPTSSFDWHRLLPMLEGKRRVILFDLPGFGFSEKPLSYGYALFEQADLVEVLLRELGVGVPVHLVAHDMGTSIACELLARRAVGLGHVSMRSLVLMNGSIYIEMAHLTPSQRLLRSPLGPFFARWATRRLFHFQMGRILEQPLPPTELEAMWAQLQFRDGRERLPQIIRYLEERWRFRHRWIGALRTLDIPTLVLWGVCDPVARFAIGERLAREIPHAHLEPLGRVGHYPQLEDPGRTGEALLRFLDQVSPAA
ncbi:MAG: alpha/beta hydrolase [Deltaproteobacteria bacterium]|nr:MAG: alpha/beta hydrolase [Deltaproteobacteria bacterium]